MTRRLDKHCGYCGGFGMEGTLGCPRCGRKKRTDRKGRRAPREGEAIEVLYGLAWVPAKVERVLGDGGARSIEVMVSDAGTGAAIPVSSRDWRRPRKGVPCGPLPVPRVAWGRDHFSVLLYFETCCVDGDGTIDPARMRCNPARRPGLSLPQHQHYPGPYPHATRLSDGSSVVGHDDWDCLDDLEKEGLVMLLGTGIHPVVELTRKGSRLAASLRAWKASGKPLGKFRAPDGARSEAPRGSEQRSKDASS